jgi:hypothetical protein
MAKYDVKFSCGHEGTVELFGKSADRERKIAYFEKHGVCSECYKMQQAAAVAEKTAAWELPELTGTPKQIAWAERIRSDFFAKFEQMEKEDGQSTAEAAEKDARFEHFLSWVKGQTEARFWIDHNGDSPALLGREWAKNNPKEVK